MHTHVCTCVCICVFVCMSECVCLYVCLCMGIVQCIEKLTKYESVGVFVCTHTHLCVAYVYVTRVDQSSVLLSFVENHHTTALSINPFTLRDVHSDTRMHSRAQMHAHPQADTHTDVTQTRTQKQTHTDRCRYAHTHR